MMDLPTIPLVTVLLAGVLAGVMDIWKFRVYNLLTIPLLVTGLLYHSVVAGMEGFTFSLCGAAFGLGILFVPYLLGGMGAGDVKLCGGVGAWLGLPITIYVIVAAVLAAGFYAVVQVMLFGTHRQAIANLRIAFYQVASMVKHLGPDERVEMVVRQDDRRRHLIPFAAMVPVGMIALLVWSKLL